MENCGEGKNHEERQAVHADTGNDIVSATLACIEDKEGYRH
jgi:hypothetical protein